VIEMGDLERILPDDLMKSAVMCGKEVVLPYLEALRAIAIASNHLIAVLGVESFEVVKDRFQVISYSGYDCSFISFAGDWKAFVSAMNTEAQGWVNENRLGENYGYILTSTSETEFMSLPSQIK
jgi:hypothetical protein